jgi:putative cardiolipin synthase
VALQSSDRTALGKRWDGALRAHPGLAGMRLLSSGRESFAARVEMSKQAEKTLDVQYFIVQGDNTGRLFLNELIQAADRGVRVRLLIDDSTDSGRDAQARILDAHPNIEVRAFNPFLYRGPLEFLRYAEFVFTAPRLAFRMHNKLMVADDSVAVISGRNIGDEYFAAS